MRISLFSWYRDGTTAGKVYSRSEDDGCLLDAATKNIGKKRRVDTEFRQHLKGEGKDNSVG